MRLLASLLLLCSCGNLPVESNETSLLFVLAGQSNFAGAYQENDGALPKGVIESHRNNDNSFSKDSSYAYPNFGPATNIARYLEVKYPGKKIKVLNAAVRATSMYDWRTDGELYKSMIKKVNEEILDGSKLESIFWYQGESDASVFPEPAVQKPNEWANLFIGLSISIRRDLGDVKLVFAQLSTTTNAAFPNWEVVKSQQEIVNKTYNYPMVITEDLTTCDGLHLDKSEFDKLAARFINM